ncbi:hypothetical protein MZO42_01590 [Sphingomonas psychrotolerans]|uniref:Uncharacterized protein n=1 Tax=Sphingomonas psychrotolerans TaxID=1327635 RepID=A0ABU3MYJ2_9SPHN|nr:hypothetical protein [Sphingomonas psychrotolerans]MDT8757380.1 hypothetical protein [Sphingomonas psychrotolerans]
MSNNITTGLTNIALTPMSNNRMTKGSAPGTWFEALADAWGQTLDQQATRIETMSDSIGEGTDNPSQITKLTAESMRMSFMANSSSSSIDSVGKALETMARKN